MKTASHTAILRRLLLLVFVLATVLGCRQEREAPPHGINAPPRTATEAANAWPGRKLDFTDQHGEKLLRLRQRRTGYRVFGPDLKPLGEVKMKGDRIVMAGRDGKPVFVFEPAELASKGLPGEPSRGFVLREAGEDGKKIGHLGTGMTGDDAPLWRAYDANGETVLTWSAGVEGAVDLRFVVPGTAQDVHWKVAVERERPRVVTARPEGGEKDSPALLSVAAPKLSPAAVAPIRVTRLDPLVRVGMLLAIRGPKTPAPRAQAEAKGEEATP